MQRTASLRPLSAVLMLLSAAALPAADPTEKPVAAAQNPALVQIEDEPGLPRLLLVGDSISMGYTLPVRVRLHGRANVHHPPENCGDTARGLRRLDAWLGAGRWDVIVFNFGLHDLKYLDAQGKYVPPAQGTQVAPLPRYEANLRELTARLRRTGARLLYATTTPVPAGSLARVEHDEVGYNETARRVMQEAGVPVLDLWALVKPRQAEWQLPHNVHFTDAGYDQLGASVAGAVTELLAPPAK